MIRAAAGALLVLTLVGCGSASDSSLEDAEEATSAETSRFEMDFRVTGGSVKTNFEMQASGVFDFPKELAAMSISGDIPFYDGDVSWKEFRLLGKTGYMRWLVKGKTYWVKSYEGESSGDPTELLVPLPGTSTKPTDVLRRVLLASEENIRIGREEIRGTETTHYRARVDTKKLAEQLRPEDRPDAEELWPPRFVSVELWIDDESRLRRITTVKNAEDADEKMTVELFDYGVDVSVEPPPADEVISEKQFDKLTESSIEVEEMEPTPEEVCQSAREELPKKDADQICREAKEKK